MAGVAAISLSSATGQEQEAWKAAAHRESIRYGISVDFVNSRMEGRQLDGESAPSRTLLDWLLLAATTAIFLYFARIARVPEISFQIIPAALLSVALIILLLICGISLWRTTRFH
jgi:hypothetical protein